MYGYVYKVTNIVNLKIYVGRHKSDVFDKSYWGSSKLLNDAFKKYGKENFTREILEWCETFDDLAAREIYWIAKLNSCDRNIGYNISEGGGGSILKGEKNPFYGKHHTAEARKQMSISAKLRPPITDETRLKLSLKRKGHKHSEETKKKIGDSQRGVSRGPMSDESKHKMSEAQRRSYAEGRHIRLYGEDHPAYGSHISEDHKLAISKANTGRCRTPEERKKISESRIGLKLSDDHKRKIGDSGRGRIWINNGIKSKMIYPNEFSDYLKLGYVKGRLKSKV